MELAHLPYRKATYEDYVGLRGLKKFGKKKWLDYVEDVVKRLTAALEPDEVVLGGGNAKLLKKLPPHSRVVDNTYAFKGGFRLWQDERIRALKYDANSEPESADRTNGSAIQKPAKRKGASAWQQA